MFLDVPLLRKIFRWNDTKSYVAYFTFQPDFLENFVNSEQPRTRRPPSLPLLLNQCDVLFTSILFVYVCCLHRMLLLLFLMSVLQCVKRHLVMLLPWRHP